MAMTMAENVLARASGRASLRLGEYLTTGIGRVTTHGVSSFAVESSIGGSAEHAGHQIIRSPRQPLGIEE